MIRRKLAIILLSILLISSISTISTNIFAQAVHPNESASFSSSNVSMVNTTITNTSPKLPSLKIPSSNVTVDDAPPALPALDLTKVKRCNMTEVNAKRASNPIIDENHLIPIHSSTQTEQTLQSDHNEGWYSVGIGLLTGVMGVAAIQWVDTSYTIPSNAVLYGPTLKSTWPCPLEVSTVYSGWHNAYMIGVWDFSLGSNDWAHRIYFNEAQCYIKKYDQWEYYYVYICKNQYDEWAAFLYNHYSYQWDEIYVQANDGPMMIGWNSYEARWSFDTNWPPTPNTRSSDMMVYIWDLISGWHWAVNTYALGVSFNNDYNTGPLGASGNYRNYISQWNDWTAGAFYVQSITYCGPISGGGNAWDGEKLKGCLNDDQFARIYAGNRGDAGGITARMIRGTYGHIYVNAYSAYGYYKSHLYVYVSQDGQNWTPLNGGNPITINYWDGRKDFYCGYSGGFSHIAFAGYDDNGFSVNLYLDHVFVYH